MRRRSPIIRASKCVLIAGLYCLALSHCSSEGNVVHDPGDKEQSLQESQGLTSFNLAKEQMSLKKSQNLNSESGNDEPRGGEGESEGAEVELVELGWTDVVEGALVTVEDLLLQIRNISSYKVKAKLYMECAGLFDKESVVNLSSISLKQGEEKTVIIPVERLSVQNLSGASSLTVMAEISKPDFPEQGEITDSSEQIFYRFNSEYTSAILFTREFLIEQFQGCLSGICDENTEDIQLGDVLGRVRVENNEYSDVILSDDSVEIEEDVFITPPIGKSIGLADDELDEEETENSDQPDESEEPNQSDGSE